MNFFVQFMNMIPVLSIFVLSRLLSAFAVATFPIAKNSGLVHTFASVSAKKFTAIWCAFWFLVNSLALVILFEAIGLVLVSAFLLMLLIYFFMAKRNFGGITGDTAGWFVQVSEIFALLFFILWKMM